MGRILSRASSRRLLALCRVLLLGAAAVACGAERPAVPPRTSEPGETAPAPGTPRPAGVPIRIAFLGDSLAAGFGLAEEEAFPALVEERLRQRGHAVDVLNAGVGGDTTAGGLARLDWVLRSEPDVLVVELGANDALRGQPLENVERNLREIVRRARAAGARVLLLGMDVPRNYGADYGGSFAELYSRIAEEGGVQLVPGFIREVGLDRSLLQEDGLHPTAEGHRRLAERLVPALEELLDSTAG